MEDDVGAGLVFLHDDDDDDQDDQDEDDYDYDDGA